MKRIIKSVALMGSGVALVLGAAGAAAADAGAGGGSYHNPGVATGNVAQVPVHVPVLACGNTVNVLIGVLNPTFGNRCYAVS
ncbi:chaplin [Streptomyces sp. NPDC000410]|uniref:chaplin n=1 Tax=Streptomyces sp. NPDC000410 TaxID=3154254 RepID=UPI003321F927